MVHFIPNIRGRLRRQGETDKFKKFSKTNFPVYFVRQRQYEKKSVMELNQVFKILIKEIFEY